MISLATRLRTEPSASRNSLLQPSEPHANDATEIDEAIMAVLDRPNAGETVDLEFRRKEYELGQIFAALDVARAREIHRRLVQPSPTDPLAAKFGRFVVERRQRLLNFLADARRREALRGAPR